jgi:hypothetical protein
VLDWTLTPQAAVEAVYFAVGEAVRQARGRNSNYLGVEIKLSW